MKRWIIFSLWALSAFNAVADDKPTLLVYQSPQEFRKEQQIGIIPYYARWVQTGPSINAAAVEALAPHFSEVGQCRGTDGADVLVGLYSRIRYRPVAYTYFVEVSASFYLGNGKFLTTLKSTGEQRGSIQSVYADQLVRKAYDAALRDIARQYAADTATQQAVATARASDMTKAPCAIIGVIPNP